MTAPTRIDFVSDISCPWCVVGLLSLEEALRRTQGLFETEIALHPFELSPDMPAGGEDNFDYVHRRYGLSAADASANRERIKARAQALGFEMAALDTRRLYNSFDAHRLLHWAGLAGRQLALEHALVDAHFNSGMDISDHDVLIGAAATAGLDKEIAREILESDRYAGAVRTAEAIWIARGVNSVPTILIDGRHMVKGGLTPEAFEQILRETATATRPA